MAFESSTSYFRPEGTVNDLFSFESLKEDSGPPPRPGRGARPELPGRSTGGPDLSESLEVDSVGAGRIMARECKTQSFSVGWRPRSNGVCSSGSPPCATSSTGFVSKPTGAGRDSWSASSRTSPASCRPRCSSRSPRAAARGPERSRSRTPGRSTRERTRSRRCIGSSSSRGAAHRAWPCWSRKAGRSASGRRSASRSTASTTKRFARSRSRCPSRIPSRACSTDRPSGCRAATRSRAASRRPTRWTRSCFRWS